MHRWERHESKQGGESILEPEGRGKQRGGSKTGIGPNPEGLDWHVSHLSGHDSVGTRETSEASEQGVI